MRRKKFSCETKVIAPTGEQLRKARAAWDRVVKTTQEKQRASEAQYKAEQAWNAFTRDLKLEDGCCSYDHKIEMDDGRKFLIVSHE
jgi:hypothetical protein